MKTTYSYLSVVVLLSLLSISGLVLAQGTSTAKRAADEIAPLVSFPADQPNVEMMPGISSESQFKQPNVAWLGTAQRSKHHASPPPSTPAPISDPITFGSWLDDRATPPPPPPTSLFDKLSHVVHVPTVVIAV